MCSWLLAVGSIMGIVLAFDCGRRWTKIAWEREAVRRGFGRWQIVLLDDSYRYRPHEVFRWKDSES